MSCKCKAFWKYNVNKKQIFKRIKIDMIIENARGRIEVCTPHQLFSCKMSERFIYFSLKKAKKYFSFWLLFIGFQCQHVAVCNVIENSYWGSTKRNCICATRWILRVLMYNLFCSEFIKRCCYSTLLQMKI